MADKVKVKINALHNIGGVGKAGDVVWMLPDEAEAYVRDGYVEYVDPTPLSATPSAALTSPQMRGGSANLEGEVEDHAVMKPVVKRGGRKVARKK